MGFQLAPSPGEGQEDDTGHQAVFGHMFTAMHNVLFTAELVEEQERPRIMAKTDEDCGAAHQVLRGDLQVADCRTKVLPARASSLCFIMADEGDKGDDDARGSRGHGV